MDPRPYILTEWTSIILSELRKKKQGITQASKCIDVYIWPYRLAKRMSKHFSECLITGYKHERAEGHHMLAVSGTALFCFVSFFSNFIIFNFSFFLFFFLPLSVLRSPIIRKDNNIRKTRRRVEEKQNNAAEEKGNFERGVLVKTL